MKTQLECCHAGSFILASYDFEVEYRPGEKHGNADALSRIPHAPPLTAEEEEACSEFIGALVDVQNDYLLPIREEEWQAAQAADPELFQILEWKQNDSWPERSDQSGLTPETIFYIRRRENLEIGQAGELRWKEGTRSLPCVPERFQTDCIRFIHRVMAHKGEAATFDKLQKRFFFPGRRRKIAEILRGCAVCQKKMGEPTDQKHTLIRIPQGYAGQKWFCDFVGPLPASKRGNKYLVTFRDGFSRWLEAFPLKVATAQKVVQMLETEIIPRFGVPEALHSDRGTPFTGKLLKEVAEALQIVATTTPAYNPKSNPVERSHRDLKAALRALVLEDGEDDWEDCLPQALFAIRIAINESIGLSPFKAMFGRNPSLPLGLLAPGPESNTTEDLGDYLKETKEKFKSMQAFIQENLKRAVVRQSRQYHDKLVQYQEGDKVWLYTPPSAKDIREKGSKFASGWSGPWVIKRKINSVVYEIEPTERWPNRAHPVVSIDRLKPYYSPSGPNWRPKENAHKEYAGEGDEDAEIIYAPGLSMNSPLKKNAATEDYETESGSAGTTPFKPRARMGSDSTRSTWSNPNFGPQSSNPSSEQARGRMGQPRRPATSSTTDSEPSLPRPRIPTTGIGRRQPRRAAAQLAEERWRTQRDTEYWWDSGDTRPPPPLNISEYLPSSGADGGDESDELTENSHELDMGSDENLDSKHWLTGRTDNED